MEAVDWKDVIKSALSEVLDGFKDNIVDYLDTAVIPALEDAKNDFKAKLTDEAKNSSSVWVKIRSALLSVIVSIIFSMIEKVVDKVKEVS